MIAQPTSCGPPARDTPRSPQERQRYAGAPGVASLTRATISAKCSADFMEPRLHAMERGIAPAAADQLVVVAVLDDTAALDGDDAVGLAHRGKAVRDDDDGASLS